MMVITTFFPTVFVTLRVRSVNRPSDKIRQRVKGHANTWLSWQMRRFYHTVRRYCPSTMPNAVGGAPVAYAKISHHALASGSIAPNQHGVPPTNLWYRSVASHKPWASARRLIIGANRDPSKQTVINSAVLQQTADQRTADQRTAMDRLSVGSISPSISRHALASGSIALESTRRSTDQLLVSFRRIAQTVGLASVG